LRSDKKDWEKTMIKVASAAAVAVGLLSTTALCQTLPAGQYSAVQQYTALFDPAGICGSLGLAAGQTGQQEATVGGLGKTYTGVILSTTGTGTTANPYGVTTIGCSFPALPAAGAFTKNADGSYTATPGGPDSQNSTCVSSKGTFTLSAGNGTDTNTGLPQTLTITVLADPVKNKDYAWRQTATNSALLAGPSYICSLSTDAVFTNTAK
jgi:hypothetical protein